VAADRSGTVWFVKKKTIQLPAALEARLERIVKEQNASQSEIVRRAIDRYVTERERSRP
jgi:metal-responsive CopG/Arc/MetJ family transcriptional regulator